MNEIKVEIRGSTETVTLPEEIANSLQLGDTIELRGTFKVTKNAEEFMTKRSIVRRELRLVPEELTAVAQGEPIPTRSIATPPPVPTDQEAAGEVVDGEFVSPVDASKLDGDAAPGVTRTVGQVPGSSDPVVQEFINAAASGGD